MTPLRDAVDRAGVRDILRETGGARRWAPVVALGFVSALAEAAALVAVVQLATAVATGDDVVSLRSGVLRALPETTVDQLIVVSLMVVVVRLVAQLSFAIWTARLGAETTVLLRRRAIRAWLDASWTAQTARRSGEITHLILGVVHTAATAELALARAATNLCNLVALAAIAVAVSPVIALTIFGVLGMLFVLLRPLATRVRTVSADLVQANSGLSSEIQDTYRSLEELRLFGVADRRRDQLLGHVDEIGSLWRRSQILTRIVQPLYQGLGLAFVVGGIAAARFLDVSDVTALGAVVVLLVRALTYSGLFQGAYQQLQSVGPSVDLARREIADLRAAAVDERGSPVEAVGTVVFERVRFAYPAGPEDDVPPEPVLLGCDLTIGAGEIVGIVGRSGAGKSTLVQLLLGLRTPDGGRVLVDGIDLRDLSPSSYHRRLAVVPQRPNLLRASVRDNLRFFREDLADEDLELAARLAGIHDEIVALPRRYDSVVGEGAAALSGGQLQRLALARALAGRPSLLVLDEPTSALDPIAEASVRSALDRLRGSVTVVVIAHRASTLAVCDRLLRVAAGGVTSHDTVEGLRTSADDSLATLLGGA